MGTFTCLAFTFAVATTDPVLDALVSELYEPFASHRDAEVHYRIVETTGPEGFAVHRDGEQVRTTAGPHLALAHLAWEIGREVIDRSSEGRLLLHAAAADLDGRAVLLPAPSGHGKSTLVAALVARGFGYLTDDLAPVDLAAGLVQPYPRPIAASRSAWPALGLTSASPPARDRYLGEEGFLTAATLGGAVGRAARPVAIVAPRYRPGTGVELRPLARPEALALLAEQSFNVHPRHPERVQALGRLVAGCRCFTLEHADLDDAVVAVRSALEAGASAR